MDVVKKVLFHFAGEDAKLNGDGMDSLLNHLEYSIGEKVLLVGDIGRLGKELRLNGLNVTILEDSDYEDMCYALVHNENCNFVKGKLEYLPFEDNYFSKVIVLEQFNHTSNYHKASSEISRVLKNNGELILEDLNMDNIKNKMKYLKRRICGLCANHCNPSEIKKIFSNLRFDGVVEDFESQRYVYVARKKTL